MFQTQKKGLVTQRPDIISRMFLKRNFKNLTLGLYLNDHQPRFLDTTEYFQIYATKELQEWKILVHDAQWTASHPEITFEELIEPVYGYVILRRKKLLWAERFPSAPFQNVIFPDKSYSLGITPKIFLSN